MTTLGTTAGRRSTSTRRIVAATIVAVAMVGAGCGDDDPTNLASSNPPPPAPGSPAMERPADPGWLAIPEGPLSARHGAVAVAVGDTVLVVGGRDSAPCPPNADCNGPTDPAFADGALFDVATGQWRSVADAPLPVEAASTALVGRVVYFWAGDDPATPEHEVAFLAYDLDADRWTELPTPPALRDPWRHLVATDDSVVAFQPSQEYETTGDHVFDVAAGTWSELPADPLAPSYDRSMVWTGTELLVLGLEVVEAPGRDGPSLYRVASLDPQRGWQEGPDTEVTGWSPAWFWAGGKVVNASIGEADGGEVNGWDRSYPFGGVYDPATRTWSALPDTPDATRGPSESSNGRQVVTAGWILDVAASTWTPAGLPARGPTDGTAQAFTESALVMWGGVTWPSENDGGTYTLHADGWYLPVG